MVVWGGLRPIATQVVIDILAITGFGYATATKTDKKNAVVLVSTSVLTVALAGNLTNRWTVIFPMIPLLLFQASRRFSSNKRFATAIACSSFFMIFLACLLSILFPAVELPPSDAPYNTGVVDVFLPVHFQHSTTMADAQDVCPKEQDHVTVRILYPTTEATGFIPYLKPETSQALCEETMKHSAPLHLRPLHWLLHMWRLTHVDAKRHALPLQTPAKLPWIVYSHGLGGTAEMYSYQTRNLAANGYVVVAIDHTDGSAPVVARRDGSFIFRNESVREHWSSGREEMYKRSRRAMTEYRAEEFLATVDAMTDLNVSNIPELEEAGLNFVGRLDANEMHYMGHSFGGATSLHAAKKRPPTSVIAHEPATEWIPDSTRGSLFHQDKLKNSQVNYTYWEVPASDEKHSSSIHDQDLLILFSHQWADLKWGGVDVLEDMYQRGIFGPAGGVSRVGVVEGAYHTEFSDTSMLLPTWLGRATGLTGPRNPLETAHEIHLQTMDFLRAVKERQASMSHEDQANT